MWALNASTYKLAKFLVSILQPLTINESAEEFVDQQPDFVMDSLEVDSLFTNIPLESTIEIYKSKQESQTNKVFRLCL